MQAWSQSLAFSVDANGEEQLLDANGTQVMMLWERPYMVRCVDALAIDSSCSVLEVGFGCGYSAERIQRARPRSHTIIECAETVLERLRPWAAARPGVEVCEGTWQRVLPSLGVFDRIFFDDFGAPGLAEAEMEQCDNAAYRARYAAARSHMHAFLDLALEWHAQPGTMISGYLSGTPVVLERSDTHYSCQRMPVRPPAHCHYFDDKVAIVPLWVKQAAAKGTTAAEEAESAVGEAASEKPAAAASGAPTAAVVATAAEVGEAAAVTAAAKRKREPDSSADGE